MVRLMDELNQHPHSQHAIEKLREERDHITSDNLEPVDLIVANGVITVAMNTQGDTLSINDDGSLWAMGNNDGGFLGNGAFDTPNHPVQIMDSGVVAIACGEDFTVFFKDNRSVWGLGWNGAGPLGDGNRKRSCHTPKTDC